MTKHDHSILTGNETNNPFWNLPLDDPRCMNASCNAFIIGFNKSQERYPNTLYANFGFWTVYFYATLVGIFAFIHLKHRFADWNNKRRLRERAVGVWRSFTYRRLHGWIGDQVDVSYGILVLLASATIFLSVMPFYQGFFLRDQFRFGSPPLSVRCAMLMSALTPIMIALAGKMNIITLLTGISYAKLNIWHRFIGYAVFCLSIVHTVPHLIAPVREGGMAELTHLFAIHRREFSGTFLFFELICLVVFSLPYCRNKAYEWFKHGHIVLAMGWFTLIFWHIRNEYIAPEFFYSALGVWGCSVIARIVHRNRFMFPLANALRGFPATLENLEGNMTRVCVSVPSRLRWRPGQHCYISVPGISSLGNHPFTIASIPHPEYYEGDNELVLLIRECGGFTKMLGAHAKSHSVLDLSLISGLPSPITPGMFVQQSENNSSSSLSSLVSSVVEKRASSAPTFFLSPVPSTSVSRTPPGDRNTLDPIVAIRGTNNRDNSAPTAVSRDRSASARSISPNSPNIGSRGRRNSSSLSTMSLENLEAQREHVAQVHAWIDGPFGEYARPLHRHYEGFVTISGGSGLSASLPWIVYLCEKMRNDAARAETGDGGECRMRAVRFIWSIRKSEWMSWARRELIKALRAAAASNGRFEALIYITSKDTDQTHAKAAQLDLMVAAGVTEDNDQSKIEVRFGRPKLEEILPGLLEKKRNMIRVCGPNALKSGVANAVATMQSLVISGKIESISLDSETFGW
ncbi:hypothetical protein EJ08DRAFT_649542 [Tothia fuscella]|uniref:ferric-chelate reductase (NADPH) n=1 Tax=Tothia fuscella TaxID=1048955 RepID=A0A9P4NR10_9PEZI|nr:hypothetical protein EJ08DRAFT_649542 [Tothia fuscella]